MKLYNGLLLELATGWAVGVANRSVAHRPFPHHHCRAASSIKEKCWVQSKVLASSRNFLQSEIMTGFPSRATKNGCQKEKGSIVVAPLPQTSFLLK
ncbi:hypothetical protein EM20IM_05200 [Candidatus Methylacidiphilum infernorum]|uniref:Secreted protein n=1 Tax=Candidatus Methylacidiphilum infernorum TaxID=511746 RepID=A0ABX7PSG4_9BACT|nr:hypothetical protein [Candidatus Methylacidiphilum infernorum]QSR85924.1 hypothetical protein EM20IM_05200 [Candidatus Methylacidiphilum infernorum]